MTTHQDLNLQDDEATILVPVYIGMKQRFLLNWIRDHSSMKSDAKNGRNIAREVVGDFYRTRNSVESGRGQFGYAFPSIENLVNITQHGKTTVKRGIKQMRESGEWLIVSGYGGRAYSATNQRTERIKGQNNRYFPLIPWDQMPQGMTVIFEEQVVDKKYATLPEWATPAAYEAWLTTGEMFSGEPVESLDSESANETVSVDHTPVEVHYLSNEDLDDLPPIEAYEPPRDEDEDDEESDYMAAPTPETAPAPETAPVAVEVATASPVLPESLSSLLSETELREMATATAREVEGIVARVAEIEAQGASVALTLEYSRSRQARNGERSIPMARWLPAFGLRFPRRPETTKNMGSHAGMATESSFVEHQMSSSIEKDYGKTGQEF